MVVKNQKKAFWLVLTAAFLFPLLSAAQQNDSLTVKTVLDEIKELAEKISQELWKYLDYLWKKYLALTWHNFYGWLEKNIIKGAEQEIKRRKDVFVQEFKKEIEELKEEVPKVTKSLWEKFKEIIK